MNCNACGSPLNTAIYEGKADVSITTMNTCLNGRLMVYLCPACGHCQTLPLNDLKTYYETDYELGRLNEEDDQLYSMGEDGPIYRAQHQAAVLLSKFKLDPKTRLLDFGCGKSLTLKSVCRVVDGFKPYVYDVADKYLDLWLNITDRENCAVNEIPTGWTGKFDIVTSFYALEHIEDLHSICTTIRNLLSDSGYFYFIVPDMTTNPADFIVADHVNHFSSSSISALMQNMGFDVKEIDFNSHIGAIICLAQKSNESNVNTLETHVNSDHAKILIDNEFVQKAHTLAEFWAGQNDKLVSAISKLPESNGVAIYGAGFYGTYLYGISMQAGKDIECFIDSNPYMLGQKNNGLPIVEPSRVPSNVKHILVGLNPQNAKSIIQNMKSFSGKNYSFMYIE